jgi:hypothetical protein
MVVVAVVEGLRLAVLAVLAAVGLGLYQLLRQERPILGEAAAGPVTQILVVLVVPAS